MRVIFGICLAVLVAGCAHLEPPTFDPRSWKGEHLGPPTQVLTIGSTHLSQLEISVTPEMLEPLLVRLAAFKPDIVTHEGISGEQCEVLKLFRARYLDVFDSYCFGTDDAQKATGLTVPDAIEKIEFALAQWPAKPSAVQRRQLAAFFLAANDRPSARVQWLQLPAAERKTGDGIDDALLKIVTRLDAKPNETYEVAVALAARLGLQRVYAVDDHTADAILGSPPEPELEAFLTKHWSSINSPFYDEINKRQTTLVTGEDVLDFYRFLNLPESSRTFVELDFIAAANAPSPENFGRIYLAWWEVRNLHMVSNIRTAIGNHPGARVLNIVGGSHKTYYDAYLGMMSDVTVVDANVVLKQD